MLENILKLILQEKLKDYVDRDGGKFDASRMITGADRRTIETLTRELEEQRELAANRLAELVRILSAASVEKQPTMPQKFSTRLLLS